MNDIPCALIEKFFITLSPMGLRKNRRGSMMESHLQRLTSVMWKFLCMSFLILICSQSQGALVCSEIFTDSSDVIFEGYMTTHKRLNRSMFVKIEKPLSGQEPTKWHFLIHGLMDSHLGWEAVTQKALENGEGVIRVDLHGHARTLAKDYQAGMKLLDTRDNYRLNVSDVIQVLKRLRHDYGIRRPQVTGHSYGGGIATSIATHPFGKNLIDSKLTVIAPYVYRIDGYKAENTIFFTLLPYIPSWTLSTLSFDFLFLFQAHWLFPLSWSY